jgi:VWFA-related protein
MVEMNPRLRLLTLGFGVSLLALTVSGGLRAVETGPDRRPRVSDLVERTEVRILLVDVVVTDRHGNPVSDMRPEDFRLLLDKKRVPIDSFEYRAQPQVRVTSTPAEPVADSPPQVPVRQGRRVVLFFDSNNSKVLEQQRVRENTLEFLENNILPTDEVMVLSFANRLRVVQPFTNEEQDWIAAVKSLVEDRHFLDPYMDGELNRIDRVYGLCLRAAEDAKLQALSGGIGMGAGGGGGEQGGSRTGAESGTTSPSGPSRSIDPATAGSCGAAWVAADQFMTEELNRASQTLAALKGTVMALRGMPGRKSVVFLSQGIRITPGEEYYYAASCSACAGSRFRSALGQYSIELEIDDLYREANDSNVTFHAFDTRISRTLEVRPVQWKPGDPTAHPEARWDFLSNLALQTGGLRGAPSATIANHFEQLEERMGSYYILGHTLPDAQPDGKTHNIRVETDRGKVDLHYRRSFRDAGWRDKEEGTLQGALYLPEACRDLPVAARVLELNKAGRGSDAFIEMGIPFSTLLWIPIGQEEFGEVEFAGAVVDQYGRIKHRFRDWLELKRNPDDQDNGRRGVYFRERAALGPGVYELRAVVHDLGGGKLGGARVPFIIPETEKKELSVSMPALGRLSRGDMVVGAEVPFGSSGKARKEYRKEQVVPLLEEEISQREILVTFVQIFDPAPSRQQEFSDYSVAVMFMQDGEIVGRHRPVRVEEQISDPSMIPFAIYSSLKRFDPGEYTVRVEVVDEATDRKITQEVPLRIR